MVSGIPFNFPVTGLFRGNPQSVSQGVRFVVVVEQRLWKIGLAILNSAV